MAWQRAGFGEAELKQPLVHGAGPHPAYQPSQGREKNEGKQHMQPRRECCTPTWLTVHAIELIGVID